eukprot:5425393-Prymnesium_polylepis.1
MATFILRAFMQSIFVTSYTCWLYGAPPFDAPLAAAASPAFSALIASNASLIPSSKPLPTLTQRCALHVAAQTWQI